MTGNIQPKYFILAENNYDGLKFVYDTSSWNRVEALNEFEQFFALNELAKVVNFGLNLSTSTAVR